MASDPGLTHTNRTNFSDVKEFFGRGQRPIGGADHPMPSGSLTPTTNMGRITQAQIPAKAHTGNADVLVPNFREGAGYTGAPLTQGQPQGAANQVATLDTNPMSAADLSMILKLLRQVVGKLPAITLRGLSERPEDLRSWKWTVLTTLNAAGPVGRSCGNGQLQCRSLPIDFTSSTL